MNVYAIAADDMLERAIAAAVAAFPDLGANGLNHPQDWPIERAHVECAIGFLRMCMKTQKPNFSSYAIKHFAEKWGRTVGLAPYVTNGAAIVAAHALGFVVARYPTVTKRYPHGGPNAEVGVARRDIVRLTRPLGYVW